MEKKCPICNVVKSSADFDKYFSKERQKYRLQSYCKVCSKPEKRSRSAEYYKSHREERIKYASEYAKRPENIEKDRKQKIESKKRRRENLTDSYIRDLLVQKHKFSNQDLLKNPDLVELFRKKLKIKRIIKKINHEKSNI